MAFKRIDRRTVPDTVFEQLVGEVLDGELAPGAALPAERALAETLGVSRPTVREALQRLAHTGLVEVRQGGSTTVRDFRRHAGLEMLPRLLIRGGELDYTVVRSILETRRVLGREVAGLAAERAADGLAAKLDAAVEALAAERDPVAQQLLAINFWDHLVDAADSIVYRLLYNDLRAVYEPAVQALAGLMAGEVGSTDRYRALAAAVIDGDAAEARTTADALLAIAAGQFEAVTAQPRKARG
ncbi:FadR/GntR family transcriptional regulator [Nocardia seriolae]|uniref:GntR family transcriptional regulator n=1 Tax=Nocardia seriolae TaxID=37332 RepID=A0A0B8NDP9_9NOCA|nr:GntR family transcriptional regulator [Nocardia seriolae]APA98762.1 HTH-type transcriptional regulator Mce2R [Nocardia seriolae]MTJ63835.1 GntR family transcriptional regulator [Nocardia seriolae]MTJ71434.1 GntR family transcriptional regulator [Nocardia seriolae]MTJ88394.1 GntR family transcriptional regulator [Nocardia seriolae]MTK32379.1 GntR family transcriptional regulator [Nocardia seriolae]